MRDFIYCNPTKICFGKESIKHLVSLLKGYKKILLVYGFGSIKQNGIYESILEKLDNKEIFEYSGVKPNSCYEQCLEVIETARANDIEFILAVGGGSVIDLCKFVGAVLASKDKEVLENPISIITKGKSIKRTLPVGVVLTIAATGSESNGRFVISYNNVKTSYASTVAFPEFAILNPDVLLSIDKRQLACGVVDAFMHVTEQYITYDVGADIVDYQAEAVLKSIIKNGYEVLENIDNYNSRASFMLSANQALNEHLSCGVPTDWSTHVLSHILVGELGIAHAEALAVLFKHVWLFSFVDKSKKLALMADNVWGYSSENISLEEKARRAIAETEKFFNEVGIATDINFYEVSLEQKERIFQRVDEINKRLGEKGLIRAKEARKIMISAFAEA